MSAAMLVGAITHLLKIRRIVHGMALTNNAVIIKAIATYF